MKMNALLAKRDLLASSINRMIEDYTSFFKSKQGAFRGEKNTYQAREGFLDKPEKRGITKVQTTVQEKLDWFEDKFIPYLKDVFSVEATNSSAAPKVELVVDGNSFGFLTALDLMRLKSLISDKRLDNMYSNIPVRSDAKIYEICTEEEYENREVYQTPLSKSVERTTEKEEVILKDPNLDPAHLPANYCSPISTKSRTLEIGDSTHQEFTGEWTQRKRAELLRRKSAILSAIEVALKTVNETESVQTNLDCEGLVKYLHYGK